MSGRAIGMFFGTVVGARVGVEPTFYPAHIDAQGKLIGHKIVIPCFVNSNRGKKEDGSKGKSSLINLTAWGPLAHTCALTMSTGKAFDALVEISSYKGKVYVPGTQQGTYVPMLGTDGTPKLIDKTSFTILRIVFGEEGAKHIEAEIAGGWRPRGWNDPASPNFQLWKNELQRRMATQFVPGMTKLGFAKVASMPNVRVLSNAELAGYRQANTGVQGQAVAAAPAPVASAGMFGGPAPAVNPQQAVAAAFGPFAGAQPTAPVPAPVVQPVQATSGFGI